MPFVKSSTVLPGTFETEQETNEVMANPEHQEDNSDNQCKEEIRVQQGKHIFIDFLSQFFVRIRTCQRGCWSINDWTCWKDGAFQCWTGENLDSENCGYQVGGSLSLDMSDEVWFNHCRLCTLHGPQENYHSPTFKHFWRNLSRKLRRRSRHCRDRRGWQSGTG